MAKRIIDARVRQKAAPLEEWNNSDLDSLDGEQLFVRSDVDDAVIGFKLGAKNKKFSELPYPDFTVRGKVSTTSTWDGRQSGIYIPTTNGVYNGVDVNLTEGYQVLYWDGSTIEKVVYPTDYSGAVFGGVIDDSKDLSNPTEPIWYIASPGVYNTTPPTTLTENSILTWNGEEWSHIPFELEIRGEFLVADNIQEVRNMSPEVISLLVNGTYKGVTVLGYYHPNDTPSPINYYVSSTVNSDDGGSVLEVGSIKLEHEFASVINALYFGMAKQEYGIDVDNGAILQKVADYAQRGAPTKNLDIYIPFGWYLFKTGVDISSNGWSGRIYGDGVGAYSTRLSADSSLSENSIHALLYTKYVMVSGTQRDRFGRVFVSNGNFEISNLVFVGGPKTSSGSVVDYTTNSVCKYGVDVSSSSYIRINNCDFNRCHKGLSVSKWHGVVKSNHFKNCTYGLVLSEQNEFNTPSGASGNLFSLALNNMVIRENNFSTNKHHLLNDGGGYYLQLKENVFDLSAGSALIVRNFQHVVCINNYFEANNKENIGHSVSYIGYAGSVTENIIASNIFYKGSNYNSETSILDFSGNQVVNNVDNLDNPFIAINNITDYTIKDISFRAYENGGVLFFGNASWVNASSILNSKGFIDIDWVTSKNKIKYSANVVNKGLPNLKILDRSALNQVYPYNKLKSIDTNLLSFISGDISVSTTFRPILVESNTNVFNNENYKVTLNSSKYCYAKYDFTKELYKPSNIAIDLSVYAEGITSNSDIRIQIYQDGVKTIDEPIGRYVYTANPDKTCAMYNPTFLLGTTYNVLEIRVSATVTGQYVFSNFCIRSSDVDSVFKAKQANASLINKGLVNQGVAVPDGSSIDTLLASLRTAGIIASS